MGGDRRIGDMEVLLVAARRLRLDNAGTVVAVTVTVAGDVAAAPSVAFAAFPTALRRLLAVKSGARRRRLVVVAFGLTLTSPEPVPEVCVLLLSLVWSCV